MVVAGDGDGDDRDGSGAVRGGGESGGARNGQAGASRDGQNVMLKLRVFEGLRPIFSPPAARCEPAAQLARDARQL